MVESSGEVEGLGNKAPPPPLPPPPVVLGRGWPRRKAERSECRGLSRLMIGNSPKISDSKVMGRGRESAVNDETVLGRRSPSRMLKLSIFKISSAGSVGRLVAGEARREATERNVRRFDVG